MYLQELNDAVEPVWLRAHDECFKYFSILKSIPFLVYLCRQGSKLFLSLGFGLSRPGLLDSLKKRQEVNLDPMGFWVWTFESPQ